MVRRVSGCASANGKRAGGLEGDSEWGLGTGGASLVLVTAGRSKSTEGWVEALARVLHNWL